MATLRGPCCVSATLNASTSDGVTFTKPLSFATRATFKLQKPFYKYMYVRMYSYEPMLIVNINILKCQSLKLKRNENLSAIFVVLLSSESSILHQPVV